MTCPTTALTERFYPESRFGGFTDIDGTIVFYTRVRALLDPGDVVLDVGCGRGAFGEDPAPPRIEARDLRRYGARVVGIDTDSGAAVNPFLDEFHLLTGSHWPVPDVSVDVCVCDWVAEHVRDPGEFFAECRRVLRPGGTLCIRTTNLHSYVGLAARAIPDSVRTRVLSRAQPERREVDVFPTFYRCNTRRKLTSVLTSLGFDCVVYGHEAEPTYFGGSPFLFRLGVLHQRFAPSALAVTLFGFARRVP